MRYVKVKIQKLNLKMGLELIRIAILTTFILYGVDGGEICPKICICDIFEGYNRADCRQVIEKDEIISRDGKLVFKIF